MQSLLCLLMLALVPTAEPSPASFHEAETKALEVRQAIHSGELRLRLNSDRARDSLFHIFFDGPKVRFDRSRQVAGIRLPPSSDGATEVKGRAPHMELFTKTVITPDKYIFFSPSKLEDGNSLSVKSGPMTTGESYEKDIFDIRTLGIVPLPYSLLYRHHAKDVLANADRVNSWASEDMLGGIRCIKCVHTTERGNTISVWVAPEQGYSILKSQGEHTSRSGALRVYRVESVLEHHIESDVWFPSEVRFQSLRDGEILEEEQWYVEQAMFNQPIGPETFELAGLEIPDGHTVIGVPEAQPVGFAVWDAEEKKAVQPNAEKIKKAMPKQILPSTATPIEEKGKERHWVKTIIVLNVIVIGIVILAIWLHSKQRKAS